MGAAAHGVSHQPAARRPRALETPESLDVLEHVTDNPLPVARWRGEPDQRECQTFDERHAGGPYKVFNRRSSPAVMAPNAL